MHKTGHAPPRVGQVLAGKYRIERVLGSGGMGVVVAATHLDLQELRAIKLMHPENVEDTRAVDRFLREARAAVRLEGEHVARVLDVGRLESGAPYIVMEHLVGSDLGRSPSAAGRCRSRRRRSTSPRPRAPSPGPTRRGSSTAISSHRTSS